MNYCISNEDPIFKSEPFQKDVLLFDVLEKIRDTSFLLASDGESFVIARNTVSLPAWIWTSEDISVEQFDTLFCLLSVHFAGRECMFTAKVGMCQQLEAAFAAKGFSTIKTMGLNFYQIHQIIFPAAKGLVRHARDDDRATVEAFYRNFNIDCFGREPAGDITLIISNYLADPSYYLLEVNGKVVSSVYAKISIDGSHSRLGLVYTPPEERRKGYASYLAAYVCVEEQKAGRYSVLYADTKNPASNRAYVNIGFEPGGELKEAHMEKA